MKTTLVSMICYFTVQQRHMLVNYEQWTFAFQTCSLQLFIMLNICIKIHTKIKNNISISYTNHALNYLTAFLNPTNKSWGTGVIISFSLLHLNMFLYGHGILEKFQSGFKSCYSNKMGLLKVRVLILVNDIFKNSWLW